MGLDKATQEPSKIRRKRSDLVVWFDRTSETAFFTIELKTPATSIGEPGLLADAENKAKSWDAPFFAIWNMQSAELFRTPETSRSATPADRVQQWPPDPLVKNVEDWLRPEVEESLRERARDILDTAWSAHTSRISPIPLDASAFVERVGRWIFRLRKLIRPALSAKLSKNRKLRRQVRAVAAAQGILGFVEDLDEAIAGQYAYRLVGQILFYFALRRRQPALAALTPGSGALRNALRPYWDDVRRFDYEALYQPGQLDDIVPLPPEAEKLVREIILEFAFYDWNRLGDDVLGSIFENLLPKEEQTLLGQFYTPPRVADIIVALTINGSASAILDPGCGSGTFLMRAYDYLHRQTGLEHTALLSRLWGFDISAFATELAAINLFRQDLSSFHNFPRIVPGDYFERVAGQVVLFPPAKAGGPLKVHLPLPHFDAVIGNPPYLRSQNQDDLDPKYKEKLFNVAAKNSILAASKTDLFAFFV